MLMDSAEGSNQSNQASWTYNQDNDSTQPVVDYTTSRDQPISWTGSEFIANQKTALWYMGFILFTVVVCGLIYIFTKDWLSIVFVAIVSLLFVVIASRKPRQLQYSIDNDGIHVGIRNYSFVDFKSFSFQKHGAIGYVSLMPLHRLHNELSIYFPPENESQILEALAARIPNEQRRENPVDKLSKLIRF
jgi:hypothetical protein